MSMDYDAIRRRVDDMRVLFEGTGDVDLEKILRNRARSLAARVAAGEDRTVVADAIVLRRGRNLLAFPVAGVREVRAVKTAALPFATPYVPGLFQVRGHSHCMLDVEPFYGEPESLESGSIVQVAVLESATGLIGLRVDAVVGPRQIYLDEKLETLDERKRDFVTFVTRDLTLLIDIERLLKRPEFVLSA